MKEMIDMIPFHIQSVILLCINLKIDPLYHANVLYLISVSKFYNKTNKNFNLLNMQLPCDVKWFEVRSFANTVHSINHTRFIFPSFIIM